MTTMPLHLKAIVATVVTVLVGGAIFLIAERGPAMLLDMAAGAMAFICL